MKNFATAKILRVKQDLRPAAGEKIFKFSIAICINCVAKMFIWGHFRGIMELLLNNYLGHWDILIFEKTFAFLIVKSAIKPTPLLHANFQMPWRTKCPGAPNATDRIGGDLNISMNQNHQSPLQRVASRSFQSAIYIRPMGGRTPMLGQINLQLIEELGCSKRLTGDCTIMNS